MHTREVKVKFNFVLDTISTINRVTAYFVFQTGTLIKQ